jgi:hypothetical protein
MLQEKLSVCTKMCDAIDAELKNHEDAEKAYGAMGSLLRKLAGANLVAELKDKKTTIEKIRDELQVKVDDLPETKLEKSFEKNDAFLREQLVAAEIYDLDNLLLDNALGGGQLAAAIDASPKLTDKAKASLKKRASDMNGGWGWTQTHFGFSPLKPAAFGAVATLGVLPLLRKAMDKYQGGSGELRQQLVRFYQKKVQQSIAINDPVMNIDEKLKKINELRTGHLMVIDKVHYVISSKSGTNVFLKNIETSSGPDKTAMISTTTNQFKRKGVSSPARTLKNSPPALPGAPSRYENIPFFDFV